MTTTPLTEARDRLSELVDDVERTHERVTITGHGEAVAVLGSPGGLEALEEALDLLASPDLLRQLNESRSALEAGDAMDADELATLLARRKDGT